MKVKSGNSYLNIGIGFVALAAIILLSSSFVSAYYYSSYGYNPYRYGSFQRSQNFEKKTTYTTTEKVFDDGFGNQETIYTTRRVTRTFNTPSAVYAPTGYAVFDTGPYSYNNRYYYPSSYRPTSFRYNYPSSYYSGYYYAPRYDYSLGYYNWGY